MELEHGGVEMVVAKDDLQIAHEGAILHERAVRVRGNGVLFWS